MMFTKTDLGDPAMISSWPIENTDDIRRISSSFRKLGKPRNKINNDRSENEWPQTGHNGEKCYAEQRYFFLKSI
jgi:hypothetical protein